MPLHKHAKLPQPVHSPVLHQARHTLWRLCDRLPNYAVLGIKAARYARRGPALAPASAFLGEARPARAALRTEPPLISQAHQHATRVLHDAVFLGDSLSRSRPPPLGRSLRSRRMRSAAPNLDPM